MITDTTPSRLRGTAFGLFYLVSGIMMFIASVLAGFVWQKYNPSTTFLTGSFFCLVTLFGLIIRPSQFFSKFWK
jgi:predicted MFS family arabinose efflux permease